MTRKRVTAKLILAPSPLLTTVCEPVEDGEDVSGIIRDMMHVLTNSKTGVGLAAPQAGHLKRIILVSPNGFPEVLVNPVIMSWRNIRDTREEGCLSYPGVLKEISRFKMVSVNCTIDGDRSIRDFWGFTARIIQHEIDHLNGKCKVGEK